MSTRTNSQYRTSTSKIVNILDRKELSFRELSQALHPEDEEMLSRELNKLIDNNVIARKFHDHHVTYARIPNSQAVRLLQKLEERLQ